MAGEKVHSYEKAFLILSAAMLVVFLATLGWTAFGMGFHLPSRSDEIPPDEVRETPPFDDPGVHETEDGLEVVVIGRAFGFEPAEIHVPAGREITFKVTSVDVVHGFYIERTRVNLMLLPGQVSALDYTFREPGEHLLICHEYCGVGHHAMFGRVIVEEAEAWEASR